MLGHYYALLAKKREDLQRLITCQSSLQGKQSEYNTNEPKCLEPELTSTTWQGNHANKFDDIRESGIHTSYVDISGTQFSNVFSAISAKISELNAEIISIQQIITNIEAEQARQAQAKAY
ncbi:MULTISPECIES: YwqH-like family protein [Psychrobacillus]|uniref:YwqH-like family protein n=1 Tax=Psychrobacillus TaxID=1221880 RepID=UPI0030F61ADD